MLSKSSLFLTGGDKVMTETEKYNISDDATSLDEVINKRMTGLKTAIGKKYTQEQQKVAGEILIGLKQIGDHLSASTMNPFRYAQANDQLVKLCKEYPRQRQLIDWISEQLFKETDVFNRYVALKNYVENDQNGEGKKLK